MIQGWIGWPGHRGPRHTAALVQIVERDRARLGAQRFNQTRLWHAGFVWRAAELDGVVPWGQRELHLDSLGDIEPSDDTLAWLTEYYRQRMCEEEAAGPGMPALAECWIALGVAVPGGVGQRRDALTIRLLNAADFGQQALLRCHRSTPWSWRLRRPTSFVGTLSGVDADQLGPRVLASLHAHRFDDRIDDDDVTVLRERLNRFTIGQPLSDALVARIDAIRLRARQPFGEFAWDQDRWHGLAEMSWTPEQRSEAFRCSLVIDGVIRSDR